MSHQLDTEGATREITSQEAQLFHDDVFNKYGLGPDAWTLNTPFGLLSDGVREAYWQDVLDAAGGGVGSELALAWKTVILIGSNLAGENAPYDLSEQVLSWFDRVHIDQGLGALSRPFGDYLFDETNSPLLASLAYSETEFASIVLNGWALIAELIEGKPLTVARDFNAAQAILPIRRDPLALDLDGDGLETIGLNGRSDGSSVLFDHDGDGIKTGSGWLKGDDGWLVLDRNGNGTIDSGKELFGEDTPSGDGTAADGYAALADEDTNHDGVVDASDARFSSLRVWRDLNQDGISQSDELFTLDGLGITGIGVAGSTANQNLGNGNTLLAKGSFTRLINGQIVAGTTGTVGQSGDLNLGIDTFDRVFTDRIPLADGVAALPSVQGSGRVRDLSEAASLQNADGERLRKLLSQYSQATSRDSQLAQIDVLLAAWADTAGLQTLAGRASGTYNVAYESFGTTRLSNNISYSTTGIGTVNQSYLDLEASWAEKIKVLEAFNGRYFFNLPGESQDGGGAKIGIGVRAVTGSGGAATGGVALPTLVINYDQRQLDNLQLSYDALRQSVYDSLLLQTRFKPLLDSIQLDIDSNGIHLDFAPVHDQFEQEFTETPSGAIADLLEFNRATRGLLQDTGWDGDAYAEQKLRALPVTAEVQAIYAEFHVQIASASGQTLTGSAGVKDDILLGGTGNDTLNGNDGDDALYGGDGVDRLVGGNGNDRLFGGADNDTLLGGNGSDILDGGAGNDYLQGDSGNDSYRFGRGSGQDTVYNYDTTAGRQDVIQLAADVNPSDIVLTRSGNDLILGIVGTTDTLRVSNYFYGNGTGGYVIDAIQFNNGTSWNYSSVGDILANGGYTPASVTSTLSSTTFAAAAVVTSSVSITANQVPQPTSSIVGKASSAVTSVESASLVVDSDGAAAAIDGSIELSLSKQLVGETPPIINPTRHDGGADDSALLVTPSLSTDVGLGARLDDSRLKPAGETPPVIDRPEASSEVFSDLGAAPTILRYATPETLDRAAEGFSIGVETPIRRTERVGGRWAVLDPAVLDLDGPGDVGTRGDNWSVAHAGLDRYLARTGDGVLGGDASDVRGRTSAVIVGAARDVLDANHSADGFQRKLNVGLGQAAL